MKYIKKVSASELVSSTGTIIDSMNPGDDQTVNAPSIHAVKDYVTTTVRKGYGYYNGLRDSVLTVSTLTNTGISTSITTTGGDILVSVSCTWYANSGNPYLRTFIDGSVATLKGTSETILGTTSNTSDNMMSTFSAIYEVPAGNHTVAIYMEPAVGSGKTCTLRQYRTESLTVIEL